MNDGVLVGQLRERFAKNLRSFRLAGGLSQEGLADVAKLHRTYVSSVERGERNITIDNIEKFALALGIEPMVLLQKI